MSEWKTIESAPRDGTAVLVWAPGERSIAEGAFRSDDPGVVVARFGEYSNNWNGDLVEFERGWESTGSYTITLNLCPTHWMPLPSPPAPEGDR